jgi:hypothetical protein
MRRCKMEKIQPEKVMEMLRKKGVEITLEQARLILDFLRKLADITVTEYLNQ